MQCAFDRSKSLKSLCSCIAVALAMGSPLAAATGSTWVVNSCDDDVNGDVPSKSGTLRFDVQYAATGDTVSLESLPSTCSSTITVKAGAINVAQKDLTLKGPQSRVAITGKYNLAPQNDRIFKHTGTGLFTLENLNISDGAPTSSIDNVLGGCIYSAGSVYLSHSSILLCTASAPNHYASGGAVYAKKEIVLGYSAIANSKAVGHASVGGGTASLTATIKYSTVSGNTSALGGGIAVKEALSIVSSTISANTANTGGGLSITNDGTTDAKYEIVNSTISGNSAVAGSGGGLTVEDGYDGDSSLLSLSNSTVAFNTSSYEYGSGIQVRGYNTALNLTATIVSNNVSIDTQIEYDLYVPNFNSNASAPENNLIRQASIAVYQTVGAPCPLLGSLKNNGGLTQTHSLLSRSPAIGLGGSGPIVDPVSKEDLQFDQRGNPYLRYFQGESDIGAYEVQRSDVIFNTEFEGCPQLPTM